MKTLEEVIKANECCDHGEPDSRCEDCPYNGVGACCAERETDALFYLKEYHEHLKWQAYEEHCLAEEKKKIKQAYEQGNRKAEEARERYLEAFGNYEEILTDYVALKQYWTEQQENHALTWDELKNMVGKPVWVEALLYKQWAVIAYIGEDYIRFEGANLYAPECRIYMGEDNGWQAYRKERA